MNIVKELTKEMEISQKRIDEIKKYIERNKNIDLENRIACSSSHKIPQYYLNGDYATKKDRKIVSMVAQLNYYRHVLTELEKVKKQLRELLYHYENHVIDEIFLKQCEGRRRLVKPIQETKEQFVLRWIQMEYEPSNQWEDTNTQFVTILGEKVRSKAEKIIADELTNYKIPYRYEYPLELNVGNRIKVFRPDFMVLNPNTRKEFILEHLGLVDKTQYYNNNLSKIGIYEQNGFLIGRDLLLLHETSEQPINVQILRQYIEEYFL